MGTMVRMTLLTAGLTFAAGGAWPVDESRLQTLAGLICGNGGTMDDRAAASLLPGRGFTPAEVRELEAEMMARGMIDRSASVRQGTVVMKTGVCR